VPRAYDWGVRVLVVGWLLVCSTLSARAAPVAPARRPPKKPTPSCSQQTAVDAAMYQCSFGVASSVVSGVRTANGWALLDTGATGTLVRTAKRGAPERPVASVINIATGFSFDSTFTSANTLWDFRAPTGGQVATIGTDLMKLWAVRLSTTDSKVYFSDDQHACSAKELAAAGYHRLDTEGYYQRKGAFVSIGKYAAPTVPTVEVSVLGHRVRAQLDTGYEGPERQLQVNKVFFQELNKSAKLGRKEVRTVGKFRSEAYVRPEGDFALVDSDTHELFGRRPAMVIVVKEGEGGIASWSVPAVQMSSVLFFEIADAAELRADQHAMWVHAREQPLDASTICR
jgi:hypothetical protein